MSPRAQVARFMHEVYSCERINVQNNSNNRRIEHSGPVLSAYTAIYSKFVPEEASLLRFIGSGLQVAQGITRSRSEDEYHDERYHQVTRTLVFTRGGSPCGNVNEGVQPLSIKNAL